VGLQTFAHVARVAEGVNQVAAVDNVQTLAHVEVPREAVAFPGEVGGNLTDRRRTVTPARAAGGCRIKRNAGDHPVGVAVVRLEVQRQTQKTKRVRDQGIIVLMT